LGITTLKTAAQCGGSLTKSGAQLKELLISLTKIGQPIALDIETAPAPEWAAFPDAALDANRSVLSLLAISGVAGGMCLRETSDLLCAAPYSFVTHNGKFDFKKILRDGAPLTLDNYGDDTMLMAVALTEKIPDEWLADYAAERKRRNEAAGKSIHRAAGKYSLKTLAPFFLGVEPFWEVADHDDESYALTDTHHTAALAVRLTALLKERGGWEFYKECLLPWSKMLLEAELRGVMLDFDLLERFEGEYSAKALSSEQSLREIWAPQYTAYLDNKHEEVRETYSAKKATAISKLRAKTPLEMAMKAEKTGMRYEEMARAASMKIKPLSLASPTQLKWLLKESLGLDVTTFDGEDESTGKAVLERLAGQDVPGVTELLAYRQASKLTTAFFPAYREMAYEGAIHCSFNLNGTRTGRLSSSSPNLQQISKKIMGLFKARDGYRFVYRDVSAIEPRLIAYTTECKKLCDIFLRGTDFHSENVRTMLGIQEEDAVIKAKYGKERDLVKEVGLALMYGAGAGRIEECAAKRGFRWTYKECKEKYNRFKGEYTEVWRYKENLEDEIRRGALIENVLGRPLSFDPERLHMQSLNTLIQSGGSDVLLESVRRAKIKAGEAGVETFPLLFIHDAAVLETPTDEAPYVYDLLGETIAEWELPTRYGAIPLKSEGKVCEHLGVG
jgi:DNA polymerase I-like protein with 3'-5' exonuclease and polymerase domains